MSVQPTPRMTVDEFLAWADDHPGRYELVRGEVFAIAPQGVRHARTKFSVQSALQSAIRETGLRCEMLPDGIGVRIDDWTSYEPDALVHCSVPLDPDAMMAPEPIIVVEIVASTTTSVDTNLKLEGYFRVPSIQHYLIVEPTQPMVIHHRRLPDDTLEMRIVSTATLDLTPPGLSLTVSDLFGVPCGVKEPTKP